MIDVWFPSEKQSRPKQGLSNRDELQTEAVSRLLRRNPRRNRKHFMYVLLRFICVYCTFVTQGTELKIFLVLFAITTLKTKTSKTKLL